MPGLWDISERGVGMERISYEPFTHDVGSLVSLSWIPHAGEPTLGFVRWFKEPKHGEQKLGIESLRERFQMFKAMSLYASDERSEQRNWPVLLIRREDGVHAIIPEANVRPGFVFMMMQDGKQAYLKVVEIVEEGPNYTRAKVARAAQPKQPGTFQTT